jgi:hypothetical protein
VITFSEFFKLNREIILFVYGLVFFLLGFAVILQTRRSSRLELARSLRWLAAFGITHGFYEWGDLFIPIQGEYLNDATMNAGGFVRLFTGIWNRCITCQPKDTRISWSDTCLIFLLGNPGVCHLPRRL